MTEHQWKRSSRSHHKENCVEITTTLDRIRDSKDPHGPTLEVDATTLLSAIKNGRFND